MAYKYAQTGPPFHFLGNLSESQQAAFSAWISSRVPAQAQVQAHHQIRAQQLRKTAGMLEAYYATMNTDALSPNFQKEAWSPGADGHWAYAFRNDHVPAQTVSRIKDYFRSELERQDDGVFHMLHLRNQIERHEDQAQYASEAPAKVAALMDRLAALFGQPEYQAALVRDLSDQYKGEPRHRVNQLDEPTRWEKEIINHGTPDDALLLKG